MTKKEPVVRSVNPTQEALAMTQANLNALALGYDFQHRAIYLFGPLDKMAAYRFIAGFKWLDRSPGPIHVLLNSEGGDPDAGLSVYDTIRTANNPTIIEGMGTIASAAVPILLAGTVRFLNPETNVMIHNVSYDIEGNVSTPVVHYLSKEAEKLNKRYHEIIAERTGRAIKDVEKWCNDETSFGCAEAIKYGFADKTLEQRAFPRSFAEGMEEVNGKPHHVIKTTDEASEPKSKRQYKKKKKGRRK